MARVWAVAAALTVLAFAAQAKQETVSVEVVRSLAQAPYYVALGKGYFAAEGLALETGTVRSALDTVASLATGRLDASIGAATAGFFNAANRGFDLRAVAALGIQGPVMSTPPVVRTALWQSGAIRSGKDLKGRKVAINAPGDITEYFLTLIMRKYGMTLKDVDVNPLGFADQLVAFRNGAIDAGFLPEPLATTAVMAGSVALLKPEDGIGQGAVTTYVFFGTKFMHDRPNVAIAFLRALLRGARETQGDYNKDPTLAAMIAKEMDLKPAAIEESTSYEIDPTLDISKYEASLRQQETVHRENGRLNYQEPLSFQTVLDPSLVRKAAASLK